MNINFSLCRGTCTFNLTELTHTYPLTLFDPLPLVRRTRTKPSLSKSFSTGISINSLTSTSQSLHTRTTSKLACRRRSRSSATDDHLSRHRQTGAQWTHKAHPIKTILKRPISTVDASWDSQQECRGARKRPAIRWSRLPLLHIHLQTPQPPTLLIYTLMLSSHSHHSLHSFCLLGP